MEIKEALKIVYKALDDWDNELTTDWGGCLDNSVWKAVEVLAKALGLPNPWKD